MRGRPIKPGEFGAAARWCAAYTLENLCSVPPESIPGTLRLLILLGFLRGTHATSRGVPRLSGIAAVFLRGDKRERRGRETRSASGPTRDRLQTNGRSRSRTENSGRQVGLPPPHRWEGCALEIMPARRVRRSRSPKFGDARCRRLWHALLPCRQYSLRQTKNPRPAPQRDGPRAPRWGFVGGAIVFASCLSSSRIDTWWRSARQTRKFSPRIECSLDDSVDPKLISELQQLDSEPQSKSVAFPSTRRPDAEIGRSIV
jgi:hypothetical protein